MKICNSSYVILDILDKSLLKRIEIAGRTCYKSEDKITEDSASKFVRMLVKRGHEAMIEHVSFSVKFIVDRGVSHEIVRHRHFSFAQESTRYVNYNKKGMEFIQPKPVDVPEMYRLWKDMMYYAEIYYNKMIDMGVKPEMARSVLPNSLKTEIIVTGNMRQWRHFLKLRTHKTAHPQIREVAVPLLEELKQKLPELFEDI
jgi:thymidylate synthase (FAD)